MKTNKNSSEHYVWGDNCSGWHLLKTKRLSIIEELMPANTSEQRHYHTFSQQYFYILKGKASFELEGETINVEQGERIYIKPKMKHQIRNSTTDDLEFLVISQPATKNDRTNII